MLDIPNLYLAHLETPITEEDMWAVVKALPPDKWSGPDGFTDKFYKSCWGIIKCDIMRVADAFWKGDKHGFGDISRTLVVLLPKKEGAVESSYYRSDNLVHGSVRYVARLWQIASSHNCRTCWAHTRVPSCVEKHFMTILSCFRGPLEGYDTSPTYL